MSTRNVYGRSMTSPIRDPELDGFLALLAARRAPRTVDAYRRDLAQLAAWRKGPVGRDDHRGARALARRDARRRARGDDGRAPHRRRRSFFRHETAAGARADDPAAALELPAGPGSRPARSRSPRRNSDRTPPTARRRARCATGRRRAALRGGSASARRPASLARRRSLRSARSGARERLEGAHRPARRRRSTPSSLPSPGRRISIAGTGPSSSSTLGAGRSRGPAPS